MYIMQERRETSGTFETDRTLWANAVSMLGQRWRLCTNIETALGECPVFAGKSFYWTLGTRYSQEEGDDGWGKDNSWADFADGSNSVLMSKTTHNIKTIYIDPMFVYCWASVRDIGPTLNQPCVNPSCWLRASTGKILIWSILQQLACFKLAMSCFSFNLFKYNNHDWLLGG